MGKASGQEERGDIAVRGRRPGQWLAQLFRGHGVAVAASVVVAQGMERRLGASLLRPA